MPGMPPSAPPSAPPETDAAQQAAAQAEELKADSTTEAEYLEALQARAAKLMKEAEALDKMD